MDHVCLAVWDRSSGVEEALLVAPLITEVVVCSVLKDFSATVLR